jgi:hypothetical protein
VEKKPKKEEEKKPMEEQEEKKKKEKKHKHKRGELDENDDALAADHIFGPVYPANAEYANLSQEQREAQMWGPWMRGSTSHYGRPYGIGWAASPQVHTNTHTHTHTHTHIHTQHTHIILYMYTMPGVVATKRARARARASGGGAQAGAGSQVRSPNSTGTKISNFRY